MSGYWRKKNQKYRDVILFILLVLVFLVVSSFTLSGQTKSTESSVTELPYKVGSITEDWCVIVDGILSL